MEGFMEFMRELFAAISANFATGEGKIIVGGCINVFLLLYMYASIKVREFSLLARIGLAALVNSAVFAAWAALDPRCPGFLVAFKMLLVCPAIVFALGAVFMLFSGAIGGGSPGAATSHEQVIYDQYGMPIELRQVGGHYEDRHGDHYDVYGGQRAVAQSMYLETEDGDTVCVQPQGNGYYTCYGHSYRMNSSGRLEEC